LKSRTQKLPHGTRVSGARPNPKPLKINAINTGGRRFELKAKQSGANWPAYLLAAVIDADAL
jgi:hypothetical protein